jgi:inorganic pyrophosphatase
MPELYPDGLHQGPQQHTSTFSDIFIPLSCLFAVLFAAMMWVRVAAVKVRGATSAARAAAGGDGGEEKGYVSADGADAIEDEVLGKTADIQDAIAEGANSFLATEYKMVGYFAVGYACVIFILLATIEPGVNFDGSQRTKADEVKMAGFTTIAFIVGASTSALCGRAPRRRAAPAAAPCRT